MSYLSIYCSYGIDLYGSSCRLTSWPTSRPPIFSFTERSCSSRRPPLVVLCISCGTFVGIFVKQKRRGLLVHRQSSPCLIIVPMMTCWSLIFGGAGDDFVLCTKLCVQQQRQTVVEETRRPSWSMMITLRTTSTLNASAAPVSYQ